MDCLRKSSCLANIVGELNGDENDCTALDPLKLGFTVCPILRQLLYAARSFRSSGKTKPGQTARGWQKDPGNFDWFKQVCVLSPI